MKRLIYLFTAVVLLATTSCKKETEAPLHSIEHLLIGKWKFERTRLGTGVVYLAIPGEVDMIEFKNDRTYKRSTNGIDGAKGTFELTQPVDIFTEKKGNAISLLLQQVPNTVSILKDSLDMTQNVYNGSSLFYSRGK